MSWLYSRALVEEFSAAVPLDGEPCAPWSGTPTLLGYCSPDKTTDCLSLSRYGMTFRPLTEDRGQELLTLFRAASHAKTSAPQARARALTAPEAECGFTWPGSLAKYAPDLCLWRTRQCSLLGDLEEFSGTWPRWGSMRSGEFWEQPPLAPRTSESESGLLPTPLADDWKGGLTVNQDSLRNWWHRNGFGKAPSTRRREFWEWMMGWPEGWADLRPQATDRCRSALQKPGAALAAA